MKLLDFILLLLSNRKTSRSVENAIDHDPDPYTGLPPKCFGQTKDQDTLSEQSMFYSTFVKNNPSWKSTGLEDLTKELIESPVSDSEERLCIPEQEKQGSKKPLSTAEMIYLLEKYKDVDPSHALLLVSVHGDSKVVESLLERGADVNIHTADQESPLTLAVTFHHVPVVKALLDAGADPNTNTWTKPQSKSDYFPEATSDISFDQILRTLEKMNDPQSWSLSESRRSQAQTSRYHITPLARAVGRSHHDLVETLLEAGAKVNAKNWGNLTALHIAAAKAPTNILETLLVAGANVNSLTLGNITPLHILAAKPSVYSILNLKLLLGEGADIEHVDREGHTALYVAAKYGNKAVKEELLHRGANAETLPVDCVYQTANDVPWSKCQEKVGINKQIRGERRKVLTLVSQTAGVGSCDRKISQKSPCQLPSDKCHPSEWSRWSPCLDGKETRTRLACQKKIQNWQGRTC